MTINKKHDRKSIHLRQFTTCSVGTNVYILIIYIHFTIENDELSTTCEAQEIWSASTPSLKAHQEHFG